MMIEDTQRKRVEILLFTIEKSEQNEAHATLSEVGQFNCCSVCPFPHTTFSLTFHTWMSEKKGMQCLEKQKAKMPHHLEWSMCYPLALALACSAQLYSLEMPSDNSAAS